MCWFCRGAGCPRACGPEVERAASKNKPVYAFRIDGAALNPALEYFLSQSQWIDVPAFGSKAALAKLVDAMGHVSTAAAPGIPQSGVLFISQSACSSRQRLLSGWPLPLA